MTTKYNDVRCPMEFYQKDDHIFKIRELPPLEGIAQKMGDLFVPNDIAIDEILMRKGKIQRVDSYKDIVGIIMIASNKKSIIGFNLLVYTKEPEQEWELSTTICDDVEFEEILGTMLSLSPSVYESA